MSSTRTALGADRVGLRVLPLGTASGHHHRLGGPLTGVGELTTAFDEYMNQVSVAPDGIRAS